MNISHDIDQELMERYFLSFCDYLENVSNSKAITLNRLWANKAPKKPGVYSVLENNTIIYVGESGNLRGRMTDMLDSRHHVLRRNLGIALYGEMPDFEKASSTSKFPQQFEDLLNMYIQSNLRICMVTVDLGRKEIEERLIEIHNPVYNCKGRRAS